MFQVDLGNSKQRLFRINKNNLGIKLEFGSRFYEIERKKKKKKRTGKEKVISKDEIPSCLILRVREFHRSFQFARIGYIFYRCILNISSPLDQDHEKKEEEKK